MAGETKCKKVECQICGKFVTRLSSHMKIHSSEKAFRCELCGKGFKQSSDLTSHIRTHTGSKPYKCDFCQKTFGHSDSHNKTIKAAF